MAVQASSVLWLHNMTCEACVCTHVGAAFLILICFNKLYVCISWTIKGLTRPKYLAHLASKAVMVLRAPLDAHEDRKQ